MRHVLHIGLCIALLFVSCVQVHAQDSASINTVDDILSYNINDSVTTALDMETNTDNQDEIDEQERLRNEADEQAKAVPLFVIKKLDSNKWQQTIKDEKFNFDKVKKVAPPKEVKKTTTNIDPTKWRNAMVMLLFGMIALAIVIIIYAFFGKQYFAKPTEKLKEDQDNWEDVEVFNAWDKAIADAMAKNDYRLATRILYLQTLQQLNDTNRINYSKEKVSNHYLQKLYNTPFYQPFAQCNKYFDYVWYGKYPLTTQSFADVRAQFIQLQNQIKA